MGKSGMTLSDFNGDELKKLVDAKVNTKLDVIGRLLVNELKEELVAQDNIDKKHPSEAGEPPAKVTGRLSASITHNLDRKLHKLIVGTPALYGKFLELGTRFMAARPWLRPVARRNAKRIGEIMTGK